MSFEPYRGSRSTQKIKVILLGALSLELVLLFFVPRNVVCKSRRIDTGRRALLPVATSLHWPAAGPQSLAPTAAFAPPLSLRAAAHSAILRERHADLQLAMSCPGSTCSWDDGFHTLAFCGACVNITNQIRHFSSREGWRIGIENGPSLRSNEIGASGIIYNASVAVLEDSQSSTPNSRYVGLATSQHGFRAASCSLQACVRHSTALYTTSGLVERPIGQPYVWLSQDSSHKHSNYTVTLAPSERSFGVSYWSWRAWNAWLQDAIGGEIQGASGVHIGQDDLRLAMYRSLSGVDPRAGGLITTTTVDDLFTHLADSLTLALRSDEASLSFVTGNAFAEELVSETGWFLSALLVTIRGLALVAATVYYMGHRGVGVSLV